MMEPYKIIVTRQQAIDWGNRFIGRPLVDGDSFLHGRVVITDIIPIDRAQE